MEYTNMLAAVTNTSDEPVSLIEVTLVGTIGFDDVATLVGIDVAPREQGGQPAYLGDFAVDPPAAEGKGRCLIQETHDLEGYVVEPGERVAFVIHLRLNAPGAYHFRGERIVYRQNGVRFHQTVPFELGGTVDEMARPEAETDQLACVGQVRLLPGWSSS
jgi:hypothetical protein